MNNNPPAASAPASAPPFRLKEWYPDISDAALAKLKKYQEEVIRQNKELNLISAKTVPISDALHFGDSYCASRIIMTANPSIDLIYDLGSGNGFPGLVFAILYPKVQIKMVESDAKRCQFIKSMIDTLKVTNAAVIAGTIESLPENSIKYAMNRGLANISKSILITRKQVVKGGVFYHLKGEEWGMEVADIPTQLCSIWAPGLVGEYKLPIGGPKFSVVKTDKIS